MSLWGKIMAQHQKSVEQMRQARQELKKATQDVKEAWQEVKQTGRDYFQNEFKPQFDAALKEYVEDNKKAAQELKAEWEKVKEIWVKKCPNCGSEKTKKHRQYSLGLFLFSLFVMVFGTLTIGILGFLIGSLLMIIPGWQSLKGALSPKRKCKDCGHIFKA